MIRNAPCKGCTERRAACHDSCEKYKAWKETVRSAKRFNAQKRVQMPPWSQAQRQTIWKSYRRDNSGAYKKFTG